MKSSYRDQIHCLDFFEQSNFKNHACVYDLQCRQTHTQHSTANVALQQLYLVSANEPKETNIKER